MSDNEEAQKAEEQLSENEKVLGWLLNDCESQQRNPLYII